jgi:hypothetical protein
MDVQQFATSLGLPGLLILVWWQLQKARDERQAKLEEKKLDVEEKRVDALFEMSKAMATGFTSLVQLVASNHAADIESHQELATGLAELKGKLDEFSWRTPPQGTRLPTGGG